MKLDQIVSEAHRLLPSPRVLARLLELLEDLNTEPSQVLRLVRVDTALVGQVLALANSAEYAFSQPATDFEEAVRRVGFLELYKMVSLILTRRMTDGRAASHYELEEGQLWESSIAVAVAMEALAQEVDHPIKEAYTVGLLSLVGKVAISQLVGDSLPQVLGRVEACNVSLTQAEQEILGFDHAQVSAALLEKWEFPAPIVEAVACQYKPFEAPEHTRMACLVHVSRWIAAAIGCNHGRSAWAFSGDAEAIRLLGLSDQTLQMLAVQVRAQVDEIKDRVEGRCGAHKPAAPRR